MAEQAPQRETAKISSVEDLIKGTYVVQEGWLPNYVQTTKQKISRVNIIGIVVSKPSLYDFSIDDGTGTIQVIDFNQQKKVADLKVGEAVLIIGRPRKNNDRIFIACEVVNSKQLINNPQWLSYRKKELSYVLAENEEEEKYISTPQIVEKESLKDASQKLIEPDVTGEEIVSFIKKKDDGDGCLIEDIISYFGNDIDDYVLTLITMGEIYEIKPGRVKVLE